MNLAKKANFLLHQGFNSGLSSIPFIKNKFSKPTEVSWNLSYRCNSRCKFCGIWKIKKQTKIDLEEVKEKLKILKSWLGPFHLSFAGGGEPLLIKNIDRVVEMASKEGLLTSLGSNGILLDKKKAISLSKSGLDITAISLDSLDEKTYNHLRGVKNSYKRVIKNIEASKKILNLKIAFLITNKNIPDIKNMPIWVKDNDIGCIEFQALAPYGIKHRTNESDKNFYKNWDLWPKDKRMINESIEHLKKLKKQGYPIFNSYKNLNLIQEYYNNPTTNLGIRCRKGTKSFSIHPDGTAQVCFSNIGLVDKDIKKKWVSGPMDQIRKRVSACKNPCLIRNCSIETSVFEDAKKFFLLLKPKLK